MSSILLHPLGLIHTPHLEADKTPIQPCFAEEVRGYVELDPSLAEGLDGLASFSHCFLIYHLHQAKPGSLRVKPFLADNLKGVFACRYPHRPNVLGLSLVRIVSIKGNCVHFLGADMLDGTPLLDIKPYFPQADRPDSAWGGWTEEVDKGMAQKRGRRQEDVLNKEEKP